MRSIRLRIVRSLKIRGGCFFSERFCMIRLKNYFTKWEIALWVSSVTLITLSFVIFDRSNFLSLAASLIGATSLILCAKGNPAGQALMVVFGIIYGVISYTFAYYGEMITYVGMTVPMAAVSLVAWLRNPFRGKRSEVRVNRLPVREIPLIAVLAVLVTAVFYFILEYFGTANIIPSTVSVTTSFVAVYLTFRRSPFYAVAYAANDVVLIVLWTLATLEDTSYVSVLACFAVFLVNDLYGFVSWRKMEHRQAKA